MVDPSWFRLGPAIDTLPFTDEPANAYRFGNASAAPLSIYISHEAARFIEAYVKAKDGEEMCGLLVGYPGRGAERPFIVITGAIEAPDTIPLPGGVRFSHATVEYFERVRRREYPDSVVLGWFQSHPAKGPTLTQFDQFMHHRLFHQRWQVTLVVDPTSDTSQFYGWDGLRIVPIDSYYVYNAARNAGTLHLLRAATAAATHPDQPSPTPSHPSEARRRKRRAGRRRLSFDHRASRVITVVGLLVVAVLTSILWRGPVSRTTAPQEHTTTAQADEPTSAASFAPQEATAAQAPAALEDAASAPTSPIDSAATTTGTETIYVVQPGDTLWSISRRLFGTPYRFDILVAWNQLDDPNRIVPGMSLRIPLSQERETSTMDPNCAVP